MATTREFCASSTSSADVGSRPSRSLGCTPTDENMYEYLSVIACISAYFSSATETHNIWLTPHPRARTSTASRLATSGSKFRWQWESTSSDTKLPGMDWQADLAPANQHILKQQKFIQRS